MDEQRPQRRLHIGLWLAQTWLALSFLLGGSYRLVTPIDVLAEKMPWAGAIPEWAVRLSAGSEVLAAFGLILPSALRIAPQLTPLAAAGLVVVMLLAGVLHASRGEWNFLPVIFLLGGLAAFVAWGRTRRVPIAPRQAVP